MSEFRQDLVSGDWIIVAPERAKRPHGFIVKRKRRAAPKAACPFENLEKSGNWPPVAAVPNRARWRMAVIPNKFPALRHGPVCVSREKSGPYTVSAGLGRHDLVVTRDHHKNLGGLTLREGTELFRLFQRRCRAAAQDPCLVYNSVFFNWGPSAGASIYHPHYQILTLPIVPPDVQHSLDGSREYFRRHGRCVHCDIIAYERSLKTRIVEENRGAIAFVPFVTRRPFEVSVYPKKHRQFFERTSPEDVRAAVAVLQSVIRQMKRRLRDPDFNFFIHTAPIKNQNAHRHYHWHIDVIPKITIPAGFELGTGVDIDVIGPERAAAMLDRMKR